MKCDQCKWYEAAGDDAGHCRRNPPAVNLQPGGFGRQLVGLWPVVRAVDYCGEFRAAIGSK